MATKRRPDLRQRKKLQTRDRLQQAALGLFLRQGFEATSIDQICQAADVSPSTFFRYFPTKEDLVLSSGPDHVVVDAVAARPTTEPPLTSLRHGLTAAFEASANADHAPAIERARLILQTPTLRARLWEGQASTGAALAEVFAARSGRDPDDLAVLTAATTCANAVSTAFLAWIAAGGRPRLPDLIHQVVDTLESGLRL